MTSSPLKPHDTSLVRCEDFTHPTGQQNNRTLRVTGD